MCKSGNPKSRITAVLAVSKSGLMMTPTVIKRSSARGASSRLVVEEGESAYSLGQKNAWMDQDTMLTWMEKVFIPLSKSGSMEKPTFLILFSFTAH